MVIWMVVVDGNCAGQGVTHTVTTEKREHYTKLYDNDTSTPPTFIANLLLNISLQQLITPNSLLMENGRWQTK